MGNVANLLNGPVQVLIDILGTPTDIGYTKGGVRAMVTPKIQAFTVDQLGDTEVKRRIKGVDAKVSFSFAEYTLDNLKRALLNAVPLQDDATPTKKKLSIRPLAGKVVPEVKWIFKPIDAATGVGTTDANQWLTVPKGALDESTVELAFNNDDLTLIPITIDCQPDPANKDEVMFFGDGTVVDANESGF
jgi:hypothetical protein